MTDDTIFNNDGNQPAPAAGAAGNEPPTLSVLPDSVKELVGEGKKYATVEKALEGLLHAQSHITKLEEENGGLRKAGESALSVEEVHKTVKELLEAERATHVSAGLDEAAVLSLLSRESEKQAGARKLKENSDAVVHALQDKFGDKAEEMYKTKAQELGLSVKELNEWTGKSPKAVLALFGAKSDSSLSSSRSTVNSEALARLSSALPKPKKSVMYGAKTSDVTALWEEIKKEITSNR
jgi:hypothetical protein